MSAHPDGPHAATLPASLRTRSAEFLTHLLGARPDLATPPPQDMGELATRLVTRTSVRRCVDRLDAWRLAVLETVAAGEEPVRAEDVAHLLHRAHGHEPDPAAQITPIENALDALADLALIWPDGAGWRMPLGVREEFGRHPLGLAAPGGPTPPGSLSDLPTAWQAILRRLAHGTPTGTTKDVDPASPVWRMVEAGWLRHIDDHTVELPREIALAVRALHPTPVPRVSEPAFATPGASAHVVEQAGLGTALESVGDAEGILDEIDAEPLALLRDGGIGVRDVRRLGSRIDRDVARAGFTLDLLASAGLALGRAGRAQLTTDADTWYRADLAERWATLVSAWLSGRHWWPSTDPAGRHPWTTPGSHPDDPVDTHGLRSLVLDMLEPHVGQRVDPDRLADAVAHRRPAFARKGRPQVEDVVQDLEWLGLLAMETVTPLLPLARNDSPHAIAAAVAERFPEPVSELIVQADLTAVAPGPMTHEVATTIRKLAKVESRGGATVFRFTSASIQQAFDHGWSASGIMDWVSRHSTTQVPQPLHYLVNDVARRHGQIRVGTATCWVTLDDPAQMTLAMSDPDTVALGITRITDTALVADAEPDEVVAWLRRLGLTPAAAGGAPPPRRIPALRPAPEPPRPDAASIATRLTRSAASSTVPQALRAAQRSATPVEVSYVDSDGTRRSASAVPQQLSDGVASFLVRGRRLVLPVARILGVRPIE